MRALGISLALILVLVVFGTYVFKDTAAAQGNLVADMLDLPAPPPPNPLTWSADIERDEKFYDVRKPPADDAPIEDLIDYWQGVGHRRGPLYYKPKASAVVVERLKEAIRQKPYLLNSVLLAMPDDEETADFVKATANQIAQMEESEGDEEGNGKGPADEWLKYNSDKFSDALLSASQEVKDENGYVTNHEDLLALTKYAPGQAEPIIDRLYADQNQPVSQTLAKWALYRRALNTNSLGDIEKYRDELKAVVEDRQASGGMRDLALDALLQEKEWSGRDEWYFGLMEDETLAKVMVNNREYTGLTTLMYYAPPDKYVGKMIELLKSSNPTVRNAAVKNLGIQISKDNPEVVRALLPWLENPNWAKETKGERGALVEALQYIEMPESVPGLIDMLDEMTKSTRIAYKGSISNSNSGTANADDFEEISFESMAHRIGAVKALGNQKDPRAITPLRRVLNSPKTYESYELGTIVKSIWQCKGFSIKEQVDGLEKYVRTSVKEAASGDANSNSYVPVSYNSNARPAQSRDTFYVLGEQLQQNENAEEALVSGTVDRIGSLTRRDPPAAAKLTEILEGWNGPAINAMMLLNLKNGRTTLDSAVKLLSIRKELMEKQSNAVYDARGGNPVALGITTCILNNNADYDAVLSGQNAEAKSAMLACARLLRADLPVDTVAQYLNAADKTLATAAERYLETNDSPEARMAVLIRHPGKARVLGSTIAFTPEEVKKPRNSRYLQPLFASIPGAYAYATYMIGATFEDLEAAEERLRKEVIENGALVGIYGYDDNYIRVFQDKAVFSWEDDEARYYERTLNPHEFERFKGYLISNNADTQPPYITPAPHHGESSQAELLMISRQGGRRVFFSGPTKSKFFEGLDEEFEEMRKPPAKLHYWLEKDVPGLEILFSEKKLQATALWKNGADMRVLIHNEEREEEIEKELDDLYTKSISGAGGIEYSDAQEIVSKRRSQLRYAHLGWYGFAGKLGPAVAQPAEIPIIANDMVDVTPDDDHPYRTRSGNTEVRGDYEGLFKIVNGQPTKIADDYFYSLFLVPGGKWAYGGSYKQGVGLYRINLQTGKDTPLQIKEGLRMGTAIAYLSSINKVLLTDADSHQGVEGNGNYYLTDPETGATQPAKGEFRPLAQQSIRALQKGPGTDEYWAAIPGQKETDVGIYNVRTFSFKPVQKVPKISFSSMDMWVDDKEGKIYLTYSGHLLSIPLKK